MIVVLFVKCQLNVKWNVSVAILIAFNDVFVGSFVTMTVAYLCVALSFIALATRDTNGEYIFVFHSGAVTVYRQVVTSNN